MTLNLVSLHKLMHMARRTSEEDVFLKWVKTIYFILKVVLKTCKNGKKL